MPCSLPLSEMEEAPQGGWTPRSLPLSEMEEVPQQTVPVCVYLQCVSAAAVRS